MTQTFLWSQFQGVVYGSLLGEGLTTTKESKTKLSKIRMILFEHFVYCRTLEWNILKNELKSIPNLTLSEIAILMLPVILFFQENPPQLSHHLNSLGLYLETTTEHLNILQYWAKTIILIRRREERNKSYFQKEGDGLILHHALNCFSYCPDDWRLSLLNAYRLEEKFPLITALTGILLGAYNGKNSLPISWRLMIQSEQHPEIVILARFYAAWCGVNNPDNWQDKDLVAAVLSGY